jgi:hypothetical protein
MDQIVAIDHRREDLLLARHEHLGPADGRGAECAETKPASDRALAARLLAIRAKQNSPAVSRGYCKVAQAGLIATLPLSLSAGSKR